MALDSKQRPSIPGSGEPHGHSVKIPLEELALLNIGRAATNHVSTQTIEEGMTEIIDQIDFLNKLQHANATLQGLLKGLTEEAFTILRERFHLKWNQLQEIIRRKVDDVKDQEEKSVRVMQLIRRHLLEVTMGQLRSHYQKVQQRRLSDFEIFKADLKAKLLDELQQKALEVDEYRMSYRIVEKHLEKRRAEFLTAEGEAAQAKAAARAVVMERLLGNNGQTTLQATNREVYQQTLTVTLAEKSGLEEKIVLLKKTIGKQEEGISELELLIDRTLYEINSCKEVHETNHSVLQEKVEELKTKRETVHRERMVSTAKLREVQDSTEPIAETLQRELDDLNNTCEELLETVQILKQREEHRAQQWLKKLAILENATREIRKEMFQTVYSQRMAQKQATTQAKVPVILKGPITKDAAQEYKNSMGAKLFMPKAKPGRVRTVPESLKRTKNRQEDVHFVTGAESLEDLVVQNTGRKDAKDLVRLFSKESDVDKLIAEAEEVELETDSEIAEESGSIDRMPTYGGKLRRSVLTNPMLPNVELTESLEKLATIEEKFNSKRQGHRSLRSSVAAIGRRSFLLKSRQKGHSRKSIKLPVQYEASVVP